MRFSKILYILVLATALAGCASTKGVFQNRDSSYMKAKSIAPTKIPPSVVSNNFHNYYPVSTQYYPTDSKRVSIVPPGLNS